jgi:hypothetical protein
MWHKGGDKVPWEFIFIFNSDFMLFVSKNSCHEEQEELPKINFNFN